MRPASLNPIPPMNFTSKEITNSVFGCELYQQA